MGDTDALRDKIAQAIHGQRCLSPEDCIGGVHDDYRLADAVLPVVTQETAQALSLLRSRVEALADEIEARANAGCVTGARREDCAICQSRWLNLLTVAHDLRSLSDNKEQQ